MDFDMEGLIYMVVGMVVAGLIVSVLLFFVCPPR